MSRSNPHHRPPHAPQAAPDTSRAPAAPAAPFAPLGAPRPLYLSAVDLMATESALAMRASILEQEGAGALAAVRWDNAATLAEARGSRADATRYRDRAALAAAADGRRLFRAS